MGVKKGENRNIKNLDGHGFDQLSAEEQRKIASMGGKASVEARRRKKDIRLAIEALLERDYKVKGATVSGAEAIALKQMEKALKGDTKAFEVVRDTAGQKPADKLFVSEISQDVIDEVESVVAGDDEDDEDGPDELDLPYDAEDEDDDDDE